MEKITTGKFTQSREADKKIEKDMEIICSEIRKKIPEVLSVILTGGFSRGEGAVKKEGRGKAIKFFPYNDYDIQVIAKQGINKEKTDEIAGKISGRLGYGKIKEIFYPFEKKKQKLKNNFYIDLKCDTPDDLKKMLPRIRTYELRNNSRILYGGDLRVLIPNYKLDEMPLSEGAKLLLDRMSQMIEYYSINRDYDEEFLTYIIQQAYAACCTSLLLLSGKYEIGYKKSMEIFKENYKKDFPELHEKIPELSRKIEQFIKWKINPKKLPGDPKNEWFIAKKNILETAKYFFSRFLNKKIENEEQLSKNILKMRNQFYAPYIKAYISQKIKINSDLISRFLVPFVGFLLKYRYYKRLKQIGLNKVLVLLKKSPDLVIFSSLIYLLKSISTENGRDKIDSKYLISGKRILNKIYPCYGNNWEEISLEYANAYIAFFLQKI